MKKINLIIAMLAVLISISSVALHAQITWTRDAGNPIIANAVEMSVLYDPSNNLYKMWFVALGNGFNISYATSPDGKNWTPYGSNPVLSVGGAEAFDNSEVRGPNVFFDGTSYKMYYMGTSDGSQFSIGLATSPDGINWTKHSTPILSPGQGTWDAATVAWPSVCFVDSTYYLYYSSGSASETAIGLATSEDGVNWTKSPQNPIFSGLDTWDANLVNNPNILYTHGRFYLFFLGENGPGAPFKNGYAVSTDGIHWAESSNNPTIQSLPNSWEGTTLGSADVIEKNDTLDMWYSAQSSANSTWSIGMATSPLQDTTSGGIPGSKITLALGNMHAFPGDTIDIPVTAGFPVGKSYLSSAMNISGFQNKGLSFLSVDTAGTLAGAHGWNFQSNDTGSVLRLAFAGASAVSGSGVLLNLKFHVVAESASVVPLIIDTAYFNTGLDTVVNANGTINVLLPHLGDVDLNGIVQPYDAALVLEYLVGQDSLDQDELFNARVTDDSIISAADARSILRYTVGLVTSFPNTSVRGLAGAGTIQMPQVYAGQGDIITYPVNVENPSNVISAEGTLRYDPAFLNFVGTGSSGILDSFITKNTPGEVRFAGYKNVAATASGSLVEIKFKVTGTAGSSQIALTKLRLNEGAVLSNPGSSFVVLGVKNGAKTLPTQYTLSSYPNPFNPLTTIAYGLPAAAHVKIEVLNTLGQIVASLANENQSAGNHQVTWKPAGASGLYFVRMEAQPSGGTTRNVTRTEKVVFLK